MNYLHGCIVENNLKGALAYITEVSKEIDNARITRYSENEPVNLILSSYAAKAAEKKIHTEIHVSAGDFSRFTIPDLCILLSNGLENAIQASEQIADSNKRYIKLRLYSKNTKLCIDIRNSYQTEPVFHQFGIEEQGHGFGQKVWLIVESMSVYFSLPSRMAGLYFRLLHKRVSGKVSMGL